MPDPQDSNWVRSRCRGCGREGLFLDLDDEDGDWEGASWWLDCLCADCLTLREAAEQAKTLCFEEVAKLLESGRRLRESVRRRIKLLSGRRRRCC